MTRRTPPTRSSWQKMAADQMHPILKRALQEGWTDAQFSNAVRDAYPWGERRMHPYRMWLRARAEALAVLRASRAWMPGEEAG